MAADKEIMKALETLRLDRPGRVRHAPATGDDIGKYLIDALTELAATFREEAGLWARSGARGWKSSETEAFLIAQAIDDVAAQLDNAGGGAALPVSEPLVTIAPDRDALLEQQLRESAKRVDAVHDLSDLDALIADSAAQRKGMVRDELLPDGHPARSDVERKAPVFAALDFGGDAASAGFSGAQERVTITGVFAGLAAPLGDEVTAYLKGEINDIPGTPPLTPNSVTSAPEADDPFAPATLGGVLSFVGQLDETLQPAPSYCRDCDLDQHRCPGCGEPIEHGEGACERCAILHAQPVTLGMPTTSLMLLDMPTVPPTWESDTMTADGHLLPGVAKTAAPLLGQPGDAGTGYSHSYIPAGGRRFTYAELLTPVPAAALPPHLSHSQGNTIGDCGVKYRLQRVEGLPQVPQWANVGGSAFHAAVEAFERTVLNMSAEAKADPQGFKHYDCETVWKHWFEAEIAKVSASSPVPVSVWRASRKGAEGRQWWEVNGPLMLRRCLDARPAEPTMVGSSGVPAIEAELNIDMPTRYGPLPYKAILDRVTIQPDGTLMIRDYKTSYERPTDTTQLGDYAWVLAMHSGYGPDRAVTGSIYGTYFDARRGEWTTPVDLLAAHPFEAFQYRVTTAHAQRLALTTGPTPARPSSYCGGCSVRYACPIMASKS